jgi:hypothetical protein
MTLVAGHGVTGAASGEMPTEVRNDHLKERM